jgi:hypothetical protein
VHPHRLVVLEWPVLEREILWIGVVGEEEVAGHIYPRPARRVEVRASRHEITAVELGSGAVVASHRRSFAKGLTFTDPAHQRLLDALRGSRRAGPAVEVETRPLARYDALIPGRPRPPSSPTSSAR